VVASTDHTLQGVSFLTDALGLFWRWGKPHVSKVRRAGEFGGRNSWPPVAARAYVCTLVPPLAVSHSAQCTLMIASDKGQQHVISNSGSALQATEVIMGEVSGVAASPITQQLC
jgi:hypothetical protein